MSIRIYLIYIPYDNCPEVTLVKFRLVKLRKKKIHSVVGTLYFIHKQTQVGPQVYMQDKTGH